MESNYRQPKETTEEKRRDLALVFGSSCCKLQCLARRSKQASISISVVTEGKNRNPNSLHSHFSLPSNS